MDYIGIDVVRMIRDNFRHDLLHSFTNVAKTQGQAILKLKKQLKKRELTSDTNYDIV